MFQGSCMQTGKSPATTFPKGVFALSLVKGASRNNYISSKGYHLENVKHLGRLPVDLVVTNRHLNISLLTRWSQLRLPMA